MSEQNGVPNGAGDHAVDDTNGTVATTRMMVVDETDDLNKDRRSSHSSRDSLNSDGKDNPAFEGDEDSLGKPDKVSKNGTNHSNSIPTINGNNKEDVEMLPLNPTATQQENHRNATGVNHTNGQSANHKDHNKSALDSMYNDYFQPVNTRRKLLRGEKLYVTRDQRAHSRGWKWIAFWGGVFTFVAAALLTGILAATGIIMSKSEPSYSASHQLLGNGSSNGTISDFELDETNLTYPFTTPLPSETSNVDNNAESDIPPHPVTTESHLAFTDIGNSLDDSGVVSVEGTPTPFPESGIMDLNVTTTTEVMMTSLTTPSISTVLSNEVHHATPTQTFDKGRSLDEEVHITDLPFEGETLFPSLNDTLLEEHSSTAASVGDKTFPEVSIATESDFLSNFDGLPTIAALTVALNDVTDTEENVTTATEAIVDLSYNFATDEMLPSTKFSDSGSDTPWTTTGVPDSSPLPTPSTSAPPQNKTSESTMAVPTEEQDLEVNIPEVVANTTTEQDSTSKSPEMISNSPTTEQDSETKILETTTTERQYSETKIPETSTTAAAAAMTTTTTTAATTTTMTTTAGTTTTTTTTTTTEQDSITEILEVIPSTTEEQALVTKSPEAITNTPVLLPKSLDTMENGSASGLNSSSMQVQPSSESPTEEQPSTVLTSAGLGQNSTELNNTKSAVTTSEEFTTTNTSSRTAVSEAETTDNPSTTEITTGQPTAKMGEESSPTTEVDLVSTPLPLTTNSTDSSLLLSTTDIVSSSTTNANSTTLVNSTTVGTT